MKFGGTRRSVWFFFLKGGRVIVSVSHEGGIFSSFKRSINTTRKIFTPSLRDDCESVIDDSRNSIAKRRLKFPFELSKFGEQKKTERSFLPPPFLSKFPFFFRDNEKGIL